MDTLPGLLGCLIIRWVEGCLIIRWVEGCLIIRWVEECFMRRRQHDVYMPFLLSPLSPLSPEIEQRGPFLCYLKYVDDRRECMWAELLVMVLCACMHVRIGTFFMCAG